MKQVEEVLIGTYDKPMTLRELHDALGALIVHLDGGPLTDQAITIWTGSDPVRIDRVEVVDVTDECENDECTACAYGAAHDDEEDGIELPEEGVHYAVRIGTVEDI